MEIAVNPSPLLFRRPLTGPRSPIPSPGIREADSNCETVKSRGNGRPVRYRSTPAEESWREVRNDDRF